MLEAGAVPELTDLPVAERLAHLLMAWLNALKPHQRVTRQMILGRLEPGHLHVQIPALLRISRTVQWLRESARCDATFVRRAVEETALTGIYVTTFGYWLRDDSHEFRNTRALLRRLLAGWQRCTLGGDRAAATLDQPAKETQAQPAVSQ
jgi:ubiquinone biosynthesis protein COQ9